MSNERQRLYETRASQWWLWHEYAYSFVWAGNCLLESYEPLLTSPPDSQNPDVTYSSFAPVMLLYASAVENLLKAILVAKNVALIKDGKLDKTFKNHNLIQYSEQATILLREDERDLLEKLHDTLAAGKYPISTAPEKNRGAYVFAYPTDINRALSFLERLDESLRETRAPTFPATDLRRLGRRGSL